MMDINARCMKCRMERKMKDAKEIKMKARGGERRAAQGVCPQCGTKMFKFLPKA